MKNNLLKAALAAGSLDMLFIFANAVGLFYPSILQK